MSRDRSNRRKARNQNERQIYYKMARMQTGDDTDPQNDMISLEGSDKPTYSGDSIKNDNKVDKRSFTSWVRKYWKHVLGTIATLVFIPIIVNVVNWVSDLKGDMRYVERMVSTLEERIDAVATSYVTKEILLIKLDLLKSEMTALIPDTDALLKRIDDIEVSIETLTKK